MDPNQRQLVDLLAELRERLRQFALKPPGELRDRPRGALDAGERLALASRLLAEALNQRSGDEARQTADALGDLAAAVVNLPTPLVGSHVAADLDELVQVLEDLACAWDRERAVDMTILWARVREAGDLLWSGVIPDRRPPRLRPSRLEARPRCRRPGAGARGLAAGRRPPARETLVAAPRAGAAWWSPAPRTPTRCLPI